MHLQGMFAVMILERYGLTISAILPSAPACDIASIIRTRRTAAAKFSLLSELEPLRSLAASRFGSRAKRREWHEWLRELVP
jgi:hypothetical protein